MENALNFTNYSLTEFSSAVILANISLALVLSMVISWVYQRTHKGISYSQSFVVSMVMMSILATIAMMILGNNVVRALGVLGIFALIRFRTIIKDTKDIAYLFFVLAIGMGVGTHNYIISILGTVSLCGIVLLLDKYNFGSMIKEGFLLTFVTGDNFAVNSYNNLFKEYLRSSKMLQIKTQPDGDQEYYFSIRFKDIDKSPDFVNKFRSLPNVKMVELITGKDSSEY